MEIIYSYGALSKNYSPIKFPHEAVSGLWKALQVTDGREWGRNNSTLWTWKEAHTQMMVIPDGDMGWWMSGLGARQSEHSLGFSSYVAEKHTRLFPVLYYWLYYPLTFIPIVTSKRFCPVPERIPTVVLIRITFANSAPIVSSPLTVSLKWPPLPLVSLVLVIWTQGWTPFPPVPTDVWICLWKGVLLRFQAAQTWPKRAHTHNLWGPSSWVNDHFPPWEVLSP